MENQAKQLGDCIYVLLAAVYLDGGWSAAVDVSDAILKGSLPAAGVGPAADMEWLPSWANLKAKKGSNR